MGQVLFRDQDCPGLLVVANSTKANSWCFEYRNSKGRKRRIKIGDVKSHTHGQARDLAFSYKRDLAAYPDYDPAAVRHRNRQKEKDAPRFEHRTVGQLFSEWVERNNSKKSIMQDVAVWQRYTPDALSKEPLHDGLLTVRFERMFDGISQCGPVAANRWLSLARAVFRYAVREGYMERSPVRHLKMNPERHRERVLTDKEFNDITTHLAVRSLELRRSKRKERAKVLSDCRRALWFLRETGARCGEVLGKDFSNVVTPPSLWMNVGYMMVSGKTGERKLFLNKSARTAIRFLEGKFPTHSQVQYAFEEARKACGIKDVRLHDLRHTFAAKALQKGASLVEIGHLLGHKSVTMTSRYANVTDEHAMEVLKTISLD